MSETITAITDTIKAFFLFFAPIVDFIVETKVPEQLENIRYKELAGNPWFLVPYLGWLAWMLFKKQLNTLVIVLLLSGSWAFFGTPYMRGVMGQDQVELGSILPLLIGACTVLGIVVYLLFFKHE